MIEIPKNTYEVSQECREEVVQMIVNAFLWYIKPITENNSEYGMLEIKPDIEVREYTKEYSRDNKRYYGFGWCGRNSLTIRSFKIRSCEAREAVRLLIDSGYYFYEIWTGYRKQICNVVMSERIREPRTLEYGDKRIFEFDYIID